MMRVETVHRPRNRSHYWFAILVLILYQSRCIRRKSPAPSVLRYRTLKELKFGVVKCLVAGYVDCPLDSWVGTPRLQIRRQVRTLSPRTVEPSPFSMLEKALITPKKQEGLLLMVRGAVAHRQPLDGPHTYCLRRLQCNQHALLCVVVLGFSRGT